jgi:hypothetical protein
VRDSLQAALLKRPEIVRITDGELIGDPLRRAAGNKTTNEKKQLSRTSRKHGRRPMSLDSTGASLRPTISRKRRSSGGDKHANEVSFDRWTPAVSNLLLPTSSPERSSLSSLVCLHGLPNPCTPSMVRRFFSGLECKRILVLLHHPYPIDILDANHETPVRKEPKVDRYHPAELRVLVQFENASTALLACERSQEVLPLSDKPIHEETDTGDPPQDDDVDDATKARSLTSLPMKGAAISVTPIVNKHHARALRENISIDASSPIHNKTPLHLVESQVFKELDPLVPRILWTVSLRLLNVCLGSNPSSKRSSRIEAFSSYPHLVAGHSKSDSSVNKMKYQEKPVRSDERVRMALERDHDQLLFPPLMPLWVSQDPEVLKMDPLARLTLRAAECLQHELEKCSRFLAERKVLQLLSNGETCRQAIDGQASLVLGVDSLGAEHV